MATQRRAQVRATAPTTALSNSGPTSKGSRWDERSARVSPEQYKHMLSPRVSETIAMRTREKFDQQRYEADFRFNLVRFRENAEGVALYHGEADELRNFRERFGSIVRNWWGIMRQQKRLTWLTAGYGQAAVIFPLIVVAPRFFRGQILLGGLMQTSSAFGQVQDSLSFIVSSYTDIAACAVVERLAGFQSALELAHIQAATKISIHRAD